MSRPVGLYAWGGPGTIRLLRAKYRAPRIDEDSFLRLYEPSSLAAARERLGVTDMWVTYSWGFSDATEEPDRRFLRDRLPGFRDQGIRTHAYVQGLNVVTDEFAGRDIFCRDGDGRLLPYSRGRSLTCPNNPEARRIILDRVRAASREDVDGVFVDNIVFGIPPLLVRRDFISFFGCSCRFCRPEFQARYGYPLPAAAKAGPQAIADYLDFRRLSVASLLAEASAICRSSGKSFGVNLYDPLRHTPEIFFGYGAQELGAVWGDAATLGYSPCLKASEFTTGGVWHALDLAAVRTPVAAPSRSATRAWRRRPSRTTPWPTCWRRAGSRPARCATTATSSSATLGPDSSRGPRAADLAPTTPPHPPPGPIPLSPGLGGRVAGERSTTPGRYRGETFVQSQHCSDKRGSRDPLRLDAGAGPQVARKLASGRPAAGRSGVITGDMGPW